MPNEEYQRMLRVPADEVSDRVLAGQMSAELRQLVTSLTTAELGRAVRDLGGHDLPLLVDTFDGADDHRPTVVFAYTVKGEAWPPRATRTTTSALLTGPPMQQLADACGVATDEPWATFPADSAAGRPCAARAEALARTTGHRVDRTSGGPDVPRSPAPQARSVATSRRDAFRDAETSLRNE